MSFTTKQQLFIDAYCGPARFNATEAARLAGYAGNDLILASMGSENLRKPHIRAAIDERINKLAMRDDEAAHVIASHARATFEPFLEIDERTGVLEMSLTSERARANLHLIKKVTQRKRITRRMERASDGTMQPVTTATIEHAIELYDAQAAAHKIRQAFGAYTQRIDVNVTNAPTIKHEYTPEELLEMDLDKLLEITGSVVKGRA